MKKLLIANRAEIAVRVIRAAREMGVRTVAVFSDADSRSQHVRLADEAVWLGGSTPSESYLDLNKIISAAKSTGADALHPGYGFLSERAALSEACAENGIQFVGPSAATMRLLGSKMEAKALAVQCGMPIVPGAFGPDLTAADLRSAANEIGYPVMLKASAGGGGRGMRVVHEESEFDSAIAIASDEAMKAFGDGAMMVEKLIVDPRHVEVQVLGEPGGDVIALFERECSIQRRHQKMIEEAPSLIWSEDLRWADMRRAAVDLCRAANYQGLGTVEFIVDPKTGKFYFMEVNARLQVEHPVTEAVTGLDLVKLQLQVASGVRPSIPDAISVGDRSAIQGHAIEARIVAENPSVGFMPSTGRLLAFRLPTAPGVRCDTGYREGDEISPFYDSLILKVIVHGFDRDDAISRLREALLDLHILGVHTNIAYLLDVLHDEAFISGEIDTGFLERRFHDWKPSLFPQELGSLVKASVATQKVGNEPKRAGAWDAVDSFRIA